LDLEIVQNKNFLEKLRLKHIKIFDILLFQIKMIFDYYNKISKSLSLSITG